MAGLIALAALAACKRGDKPDAYGNFKATEVVVSSETGGRLLRFSAREGERLAAGEEVAVVDTTALVLQREEIQRQEEAATARTGEATANLGVLRARLETARRDYERYRRLYNEHAATAQQLDRARGEVRVIEEQIAAGQAQIGSVGREAQSTGARVSSIQEQLRKSRVVNPISGTVLATYTEQGEFVPAGQPLYKVADLTRMILRAYVTGDQLPRVRIGQGVRVTVDAGDEQRRTIPGTVSWVSSQAEFTPTPVQTREERTGLVYAVEIQVSDPSGGLKIGMPGEVVFAAPGGASKTNAARPADRAPIASRGGR
ncbi:MAG TPA: HlyD family efflux transporter periplasmic adaptor subunit [Longimicrobium sp.]|nr:HlyD family efflux transporter periplasmic adaptor subunit [Longimicrobium sp.]